MTVQEIIRKMLEEKKLSLQKASDLIGYKDRQYLAHRLYSKKSITVDSLIDISEALGYEVLVRNKVSKKCFTVSKLKQEETVIGDSENQKTDL